MKIINLVSLILIFIFCTVSVPIGTIAPGCNAPVSSDSTFQWCMHSMILKNVATANTVSQTSFFYPTASFCSSNATYMQPAITSYTQFSSVPSVYIDNTYNKFLSVCTVNTSGNVYNETCRYSKTYVQSTDYLLPLFWAMTNNLTYGNLTQSYIQGGFVVQSAGRFFSSYCGLYNDTTTSLSHYMPPSCISLINNAAAMNVCQIGFMENMPSCDLSGGISSSISYKPAILSGKSACAIPVGISVASITPLSCSVSSVISSDPTKYIEGCGTLAAGIYYTGNYNAQFISISSANSLFSLFDLIFY